MSPRTPQQFEKIRTDRRSKIEEAAMTVFAKDGYHGASISKIAKEAGVSKGLLYNYFDGKEDLLRSLMLDILEEVAPRLGFSAEFTVDDQFMESFISESIDLVVENPERWKLFSSMFFQRKIMDLIKDQMMEKMTPLMASFITYFQQKDFENPMAMMRYFHAALDGVQMHVLLDPENFPHQEVKKLIIKQFLK